MSSDYRTKCLEAKGEECYACGESDFLGACSLHVHHIDGDRTNNDLENLIPLCASCHKTLHAREFSLEELKAIAESETEDVESSVGYYDQDLSEVIAPVLEQAARYPGQFIDSESIYSLEALRFREKSEIDEYLSDLDDDELSGVCLEDGDKIRVTRAFLVDDETYGRCRLRGPTSRVRNVAIVLRTNSYPTSPIFAENRPTRA